jgi:ribosomal protein S18 acetylase RimI-like enzyme
MLLHVYAENAAAISFYERLGFATLHTVEAFYGDGLDALAMHKALG